jgi:predicted phosphodiesterase
VKTMMKCLITTLLITTLGGGMANPRVVKICKEFPDAGALTLAKKLHADHPLEFVTVEKARSAVRSYLGNNGGKTRRIAERAGRSRPARKPGEMPALPVAVEENWTPYEIDARRILVLSDLHLPYQDNAAVEAALRHGDDFKPDAVFVNGDLFDFYQMSRFDKNPTLPKVSAELESGRQFWNHIRARFPRAKRVLKLGNHDNRWANYIHQAASLLADIPGIKDGWKEAAGINANTVEVVTDERPVMAGKLMILHGHEKGRGIASPVNPARGAFMRLLCNVLEGHGHRQSEHEERTADGRLIVCRTTGCLCGLTPAYARFNKWGHGCATVTVDKTGDYRVNLIRIIDGKVYA